MTDIPKPETTDNHDNVVPEADFNRRRLVLKNTEDMADLAADFVERARDMHTAGIPVSDWLPQLVEYAPALVQNLFDRYGEYAMGAVHALIDPNEGIVDKMVSAIPMLASIARKPEAQPPAEPMFPNGVPPELLEQELSRQSKFASHTYSIEALRMRALIQRLFEGAPKMTDASGIPDPTQAPAVDVHVVLKCGSQLSGALSTTPEGLLRLGSIINLGDPRKGENKSALAVHHFDYDQVSDIAVVTPIAANATGDGPRIITS